MRAWQLGFLFVVVSNAAVQHVMSLEGEQLPDSVFGNFPDSLKDLFEPEDDRNSTVARFSLRKPSHPDDDLCFIIPGQLESLTACTFNRTSKTFVLIHGWTLSGMYGSWMPKLVSALFEKEQTANIIVVDWLGLAQNHYAVAAQNTKAVGQEIARFIDWIEGQQSNQRYPDFPLPWGDPEAFPGQLRDVVSPACPGYSPGRSPSGMYPEHHLREAFGMHPNQMYQILETTNIPLDNIHLIGYSLGAHVAGFAGSHAANKVGRITGLDPAGPDFEGEHAHRRLSPDDAHFVDVLHTFTGGSLGFSIGIQQPVGHVDIYPNGGHYQPGCNLRGALEKIANFGILAVTDAVKCEHERSIHLFIDSLLNEQEAVTAYRCGSSDTFDRGMCLSCRKNRCNTVGYGVSKVRRAHSVQMYTKTRSSMPFRVYHYQLKIHFSSKVNTSDVQPSLSVSLYGTKGDAEDLELRLEETLVTNKTHSFLLVTEKDIGDLLMLKFKWEEPNTWTASRLLKMVSSWWSGDSNGGMEVHKIRIRAGETQKRMVFCVKDSQGFSQEVTFVKCKDAWRMNRKKPKRVSVKMGSP